MSQSLRLHNLNKNLYFGVDFFISEGAKVSLLNPYALKNNMCVAHDNFSFSVLETVEKDE